MVEMIYISILFENVITKFIPLFSFWDECLALLSILILFLNIIYKQRIKMDFLGKAGFYLILVIIIGIISTCVNYNLQDSKIAKFKDLLAIAKLYVIFSASYKIFLKLKTQQIIKRCARVTRYIVAIIFVCLILDYTFGIGMNRGVRYGIPLFIFLFTHATYAVAAYIFMMGILIADSIERNKWYIILCALFVILTMRAKGIVTVVIGLVLLFNKKYKFINWSQNKSGMLSLKKRYILLAVLLSIFAFRDKIIDYLSWGIKAARTGLYLIGERY